MSATSRAWWEGRRVIGGVVVGLLLVAAFGLLTVGTDTEGALWLVRATARISVTIFIVTFSASALNGLWRARMGKRLLRNRRYLGLGFATSHAFHTLALFWYAGTKGVGFTDLVAWPALAGASVGYVMVIAMALTSTDGARRRLGRTRWTILHRSGMYVLFAIFVSSYLGRSVRGDGLGMVVMLALVGALGLRIADRLRLRRSSRAARAGR